MPSRIIQFRIAQKEFEDVEKRAARRGQEPNAYAKHLLKNAIGAAETEAAAPAATAPRTIEPGRSHKESSPEELKRQRALRAKRAAAAEKHGVAIGWIDGEGNVLPGAPPIRKDMQRG